MSILMSIFRALLEAASAPVETDSSLADLCRQVEELTQDENDRFTRLQTQLTDLAPAVQQLFRRSAY